jgi:hypothetical protein
MPARFTDAKTKMKKTIFPLVYRTNPRLRIEINTKKAKEASSMAHQPQNAISPQVEVWLPRRISEKVPFY